MKKKILCLAVTVIMAAGISMTAQAVDHQGKSGYKVEFDGKDLNSNFKNTALSDEAAGVQPGDSIELQVQIKNADSGKTDWYMTNEIVKTLEAESDASGGAYEYRLSYVKDSANAEEKVLYDSATVGGENASNGEGLGQVSEALKDYLYLDRLDKGESGVVHLLLRVDGETQGNGYQQTFAKLAMNFAVEKVAADGTVINKNSVIQTIKTGDTSKVLLLCTVALVSGLVLLVWGILLIKKRKKRRMRKGE